MFRLFNFIAYQLAWFACVLGAAHGLAWAGAAFALAVAAVHLALRPEAIPIRREIELMAVAAVVGFIVDSALLRSHQVEFASADWAGWAPLWMVSLWIAFATTLNHSLHWLASRPLMAMLGGAIGGPLAYLAGAKLGALEITATLTAFALIAVLWAAAMGILSIAANMRGVTGSRRVLA
jgi:hypothetical protein